MENMGAVTDLMLAGIWGNYIIWVLLYVAMIIACVMGVKRNRNRGFILLLISVCLNLLHYLPSIFITLKTLYNPSSLMGAKTLEFMSEFYVAGGSITMLAAILLAIGLFMLVKKPTA